MSDIYKLQYNGMTLAYPGWNGYVSWENAEVAYNLYLQQQIGGTITADKLSGMNGEIVTLGNTPDAGYQFNSYGITGAELSGNQFAFNGSDVSAQANFEEAVYTLTLQNDGHGTIAATKTTGHAGDTVTLSNTYNTYYRFNNYTVTGGTINGSTFTFGSQNATAKANFKVNSFTAAGKYNQLSHACLGQSRNHVKWFAYVTGSSTNVPASWKKSAVSYNSASTGYSTAYYGPSKAATSTNANTWYPNGTISGYRFSGAINSTAHHDYAVNSITAFNFKLYYGTATNINGTSYGTQYPASSPPTTAKTNYVVSASGTSTVTGYQWISGFVGCSRTYDNDGLCTTLGNKNAWSASGILP